MMFEGVLITGAYLVCGLEAGVSDLSNRQLLVIGFLSRDNWSIGHQREVNPGVGHQVGLELGQIDVQSTVKSERSGDGGYDLANESVQVGVGWSLNVEVSATDVVDGLVVDHEGTVRVLEGGMGGQNCIVWLNNCGGHLNLVSVQR